MRRAPAYARSKSVAMPWPTPMHIVARPWWALRARMACTRVATRRAGEESMPTRPKRSCHYKLIGLVEVVGGRSTTQTVVKGKD